MDKGYPGNPLKLIHFNFKGFHRRKKTNFKIFACIKFCKIRKSLNIMNFSLRQPVFKCLRYITNQFIFGKLQSLYE